MDVSSYLAPPVETLRYRYGVDGIRSKKIAPSGVETAFGWSAGGSLPLLLGGHTSGSSTSLVYGPGGQPIEQIGPDGSPTWLHHDQLGSVRVATNTAGDVVSTRSWDAYGNPDTSTGTSQPLLGYAGQYRDAETGLQYLRARYYDPTTSQFLTRDPLHTTTDEPYGYALVNPVNATDPSGQIGIPGWVPVVGGKCIDINDPDCESIAEQHPEVTQGVVDAASGVLDVNPITATTNALGLSDTGQCANDRSGWFQAGQWGMRLVEAVVPVHAGWGAINSGRGLGFGNHLRVSRHQAHRVVPPLRGGPERLARWLEQHPDFRTHWHFTWRGIRSGGK